MKKIIMAECLLIVLVCIIVLMPKKGIQQTGQDLSADQNTQINVALDDDSKDLPIDAQFRVKVKANNLSVVKGLDENWLNILLLGTDTESIQLNNGRTDAMLVLSLHTKTGQIKLTSLIRDMLVTIPVGKIQNRINTANAYGGPLLAMKTVNEVLGLNIEHYCSINYTGFKDMVDYLGGVTLALSGGEASIVLGLPTSEPIALGLPTSEPQVQVLNGEQALSYVRIRSLDNSFGRNKRQREFLMALLEQVKKNNMNQIIAAVTAGFKVITTNLTMSEVVALLPVLINSADTMDVLNLPQEGTYKDSKTAAGADVIEFDTEKVKGAFHAFVYGYGQ